MLFEVRGEDNKAILQAMEIFNKEAEVEYRESMQKAKRITSMVGQPNLPLPEEFFMLAWEQNGRVYVRLPFIVPKIIKIFRKHKAMEKNMKGFLKERGLDCDVKFKNEKEEDEICKTDGDEKWSE